MADKRLIGGWKVSPSKINADGTARTFEPKDTVLIWNKLLAAFPEVVNALVVEGGDVAC